MLLLELSWGSDEKNLPRPQYFSRLKPWTNIEISLSLINLQVNLFNATILYWPYHMVYIIYSIWIICYDIFLICHLHGSPRNLDWKMTLIQLVSSSGRLHMSKDYFDMSLAYHYSKLVSDSRRRFDATRKIFPERNFEMMISSVISPHFCIDHNAST